MAKVPIHEDVPPGTVQRFRDEEADPDVQGNVAVGVRVVHGRRGDDTNGRQVLAGVHHVFGVPLVGEAAKALQKTEPEGKAEDVRL